MNNNNVSINDSLHNLEATSNDGKTFVYSSLMSKKIKMRDPILIAGFPGPGLVGSISVNYIIEKLSMKQIGCIDSEYIISGVVYTENRLKHPFRLYSNDNGNIIVLVCEVPIKSSGIHSVLNSVVEWCIKKNIKEVIVLGGYLGQYSAKSPRKPMILSNYKGMDIQEYCSLENHLRYSEPPIFIGGIAGGLLSSMLVYNIPATAIFLPSFEGMPDAEGAAIVIETINTIKKYGFLKIETTKLRKEAEYLQIQLQEFIKSINMAVSRTKKDEEHTIYG
ncbi:MAG: proteasome assembly chaperone family protein [Nitrososphaeraceae archaeon]